MTTSNTDTEVMDGVAGNKHLLNLIAITGRRQIVPMGAFVLCANLTWQSTTS